MRVLEGLKGLRQASPGGVLSVGNFDGIHLGHRALLNLADSLRQREPGPLAVVTFEPHPLTVLRPQFAPPRLTAPQVKRALLEAAGVDEYIVLPPAPEVLNLSAEAFWAILRDEVRPRHLIEGSSFNFGKGRRGNIARLREWTANSGVTLHVLESVEVPLVDLTIVPVSSSLIRWLLGNGRVRDAAICLGRPYTLVGDVVHGLKRGRSLGAATANLHCDDQMVPLDGVYAARCAVNGETFATALSIGTSPTFEEAHRQIEAHLIGFSGDLYGQTLRVELLDWLREQKKFPSVEALKGQIARDLNEVERRRDLDPSRPIARAG
jgi:riboflavin kinase/FMN adenylyltransferase